MKKQGKVIAVLGAQYGSEGKGVIVQSIANEYDVHVRVGSPNAGHTFYWKGAKHVMQSIPCGWTNPDAHIIIGRGALINLDLLVKELGHVMTYYPDFLSRFYIDADAGILDERFHQQEGGTQGEMHKRIGSTGEGVGPARIARLERDPEKFKRFRDVCDDLSLSEVMKENTPAFIEELRQNGHQILLEGTQGSALSLLHSFWPYCTTIDTNAGAIISEVGIAPAHLDGVVLVARTYPIRVAGNSGPMKNEITWDDISRTMGRPTEERTTVTKKVRRVSEWDDDLITNAILLNAPTSFAISFMDYLDPTIEGKGNVEDLTDTAIGFINNFEAKFGVPVSMVGTGGPDCSVIRVREEI